MQNDAGGRQPDLRKDSPNHGLAAKTGLIDAQWLAKHLPARCGRVSLQAITRNHCSRGLVENRQALFR
jgi:hypothetical protein